MAEVSITLKVGSVEIPTHPVFGDDVKIKFSREENQVFLRTKLEGKVKFSRDDFDFIASCSHDALFTLSVYYGSSLFGSCKFIKSDCTFNYDDKCCTVKIETTDRYEDFLNNYDNKYNLVRLAPEIKPLTLHKRPVLQFYFLHDKKITNVYGNMSFEVDARSGSEEYEGSDLYNRGFRVVGRMSVIDIPTPSASTIAGIAGRYIATGEYLYREDNAYYLALYHDEQLATWYWRLYNQNGTLYNNGGYVYVTSQYTYAVTDYDGGVRWGSQYQGSQQVAIASIHNRDLYARVLSDFGGTVTGESKIALNTISEDVSENNHNYLYAWTASTLNLANSAIWSDDVQNEPTQWGIDSNGKYFVRPTPSDPTHAMYPIGWNMWIPFSFWFESSVELDNTLRNYYDTTYQLPDAYPLYSAIQKLLAKVDSSITFGNTSTYSEFFYYASEGLQRLINSPNGRASDLYITPITNVKKTRYEQAAQRGDMTLKQILDMLRLVYQCYWYIDDSNRLRIEHITYFKQNHSYAMGVPTVDEDVTAMLDRPNLKDWDFGTNEVNYQRSLCPSRYEFAWGGDCTEQFNGYPIDIKDRFADGKKKEKASVTNFIADVDYAVINPSGVSDDIYVLIEAKNNTFEVEIAQVSLPSLINNKPIYLMQNGYCSFLFTEQNNYIYDLGGWRAMIENDELHVVGVRQAKEQKINYPTTLAKIGTTGTVKTGIGIGLIDEQTVRADTLFTNTTVLMEIEPDYLSRVFFIQVPGGGGTMFWYIRNNTDFTLLVSFTRNGTIETKVVSPNSSVSTGYNTSYSLALVNARQVGFLEFSELYKRFDSSITISMNIGASGGTIAYNGNGKANSYDWAYQCIKCEKRTRFRISASSENSYDLGYIAYKPLVTKSGVMGEALAYVSGTGEQSVQVNAGSVVFIGYTKDNSGVGNDDKIDFEIEVPE